MPSTGIEEMDRMLAEGACPKAFITQDQIERARAGESVELPGFPREAFNTPDGLSVWSMKVGGKTTNYLHVTPGSTDPEEFEKMVNKDTTQPYTVFEAFTKAQAEDFLSRNNPHSPFAQFVGNQDAVETICDELVYALKREDHCCGVNFALYGPGGMGKTQLAKIVAETLAVPFIRIDAKADDITTPYHLFREIDNVIKEFDPALELVSGCAPAGVRATTTSNCFHLPPCVVFFDEFHALNKSIRESLLTAIEKKDAKIRIRIPGEDVSYTVYTDRVCWIVATTDKGKLLSPMKSRFTEIQLEPYSLADLVELVQLKYKYPPEVCFCIAMYCRASARAANDFALQIVEKVEGLSTAEMLDLVHHKASRMGLNRFGLNRKQMEVLDALSHTESLSRNDLADAVNVGVEELVEDILPTLKVAGEDFPKLVQNGNKGLSLTDEGRKFLSEQCGS